jgi:hypothetical protein
MTWVPVAPEQLADRLARWLADIPGTARVAVDGADCAAPHDLAEALLDPLRALGRPAVALRAELFWRDAALRFEQGRADAASYPSWLDADALAREVLVAALERGTYLPSLRDPLTNRSTRAAPEPIAPGTVLLVSGALLLSHGLPFDGAVHLLLSPAARRRRTPADQQWTLPALDAYDAAAEAADVVIKMDDPRHPAVRGLSLT